MTDEDTHVLFWRALVAELNSDHAAIHEILNGSDGLAVAHLAISKLVDSCPEEEVEDWRAELLGLIERDSGLPRGY
jgi:hypothetical protein